MVNHGVIEARSQFTRKIRKNEKTKNKKNKTTNKLKEKRKEETKKEAEMKTKTVWCHSKSGNNKKKKGK